MEATWNCCLARLEAFGPGQSSGQVVGESLQEVCVTLNELVLLSLEEENRYADEL